MARKQRMQALAEDAIPTFVALGRQIVEQGNRAQRAKCQKWAASTYVLLQDPLKNRDVSAGLVSAHVSARRPRRSPAAQ
jgi:hypothetical protein